MQTQYFKHPEGTLAYSDYGGRLELIEDDGHYPQTEIPEQTAPP